MMEREIGREPDDRRGARQRVYRHVSESEDES